MRAARWIVSILMGILLTTFSVNFPQKGTQGESTPIIEVTKANAGWFRRAFRRVGRAFRRAARWTARTARRAVRATARAASTAWNSTKRAIVTAARWTGRVATSTFEGVKKAGGATGRFFARAGKGAWDKIQKAGQWAYDKLKLVLQFGMNWLKGEFKKLWNGIKKFDCGAIVGVLLKAQKVAMGPVGIIQLVLTEVGRNLLSKLGGVGGHIFRLLFTCMDEIQKGFWCAIPDMIKDIGLMIWNSAKAAWNHKEVCLPTMVLNPAAPFMGPLFCGFVYWMKDSITKMVSCFKSLKGAQIMDILLEEGVKLGCNFVGGLIFDAVLAVLTAGGSTGASVVKWLVKLKDVLSPAKWLQIGGKLAKATRVAAFAASKVGSAIADNAVAFAANTMKRFNACDPGGIVIPSAKPLTGGGAQPSTNSGSSGYKMLQVRINNKCLDVHGPDIRKHGGKVQTWDCYHANRNQKWTLESAGGGYYRVKNLASGMCLDVWNYSRSNGGIVKQGRCHGGANLQWRKQNMGGGWFTLVNRNSGKCLDLHGGHNRINGGRIQQWQCYNNGNQSWRLR